MDDLRQKCFNNFEELMKAGSSQANNKLADDGAKFSN